MQFVQNTPIWLKETDSTNKEALRMLKTGRPAEGTCICAHFQTEGKGQRSNRWLSLPSENLLVSFILYPPIHSASEPFTLSMAAALAVRETIAEFTNHPVEIKWPNDILVSGKKIAGILIENQWLGSSWHAAVVGIGININQKKFDVEHATSLSLINQLIVDPKIVLLRLQANLSAQYTRFCKKEHATLSLEYHEQLFGRKTLHTYQTAQGLILAQVVQVLHDGRLELRSSEDVHLTFDLSEVRLVY